MAAPSTTAGLAVLVTNLLLCLVCITQQDSQPGLAVLAAVLATVLTTLTKHRLPLSFLWPVTALAVVLS